MNPESWVQIVKIDREYILLRKTTTGSIGVYSGVLHTGPSPVVSTKASTASPPSSFYPFCIFCPSAIFSVVSRHFTISARLTTTFPLLIPIFLRAEIVSVAVSAVVPHQPGEKNIHPRRRGGRVRKQQRPFWHLLYQCYPHENVLGYFLCLPVYIWEGFPHLQPAQSSLCPVFPPPL